MNKTRLGLISFGLIALISITCLLSFNQSKLTGTTIELYDIHVTVILKRFDEEPFVIKDGVFLDNAGVVTTIGKNWVEDQLGDSPSTDPAEWISVSSSSDAPSSAWTEIPDEISSGGLFRGAGTYASTGDGTWTIEYEFTASATHIDVQLTGLQYGSSGDNNLLVSDTFAVVTLNDLDTLTVTWTITLS